MNDLKPLSLQVDDYLKENTSVSQIMEELKPVSAIVNNLASFFDDNLEETTIEVLKSMKWTSNVKEIVDDILKNSTNEEFKKDISYIIEEIAHYDFNDSQEISITLDNYNSLPNSREELLDIIKIAVREVNKEKPSEILLKKIFSNPVVIGVLIFIAEKMADQIFPYTPFSKVIPYIICLLNK